MKRILVIDDQSSEEYDFEAFFSSDDYIINTAMGLTSGVAIAQRYLPDLIICNLKREADGISLINELNGSDITMTIPLVYLSSNDDPDIIRKIINSGADAYLVKPFAREDLVNAVEIRLRKYDEIKNRMMKICEESLEAEEKIPQRNDHILITIGTRLHFIKFDHIICITALKEYSKIHTFNKQNIIVRKSLKSWIDLLPANNFLRIHRSTIINIEAIEKIKKNGRSYIVYLKTIAAPFDLSRRYSQIMRKTFPT